MKINNDLIFRGRLEPDDLSVVLAASEALIFAPHYEGFGIPLIEAMNCDVPVIASGITSIPEVAGDAALYVNPDDVESIAAAIKSLVSEPGLREELIAKGRLRRKFYGWDDTADKLWRMIENA